MELEAARWRERQITTKFQSHMSSRFYSEWRAINPLTSRMSLDFVPICFLQVADGLQNTT